MDYTLIILSESPYQSNIFEQGIEACFNLDEMGQKVKVLLLGDFAEFLSSINDDNNIYKKIKQFELFDIEVFTLKDTKNKYLNYIDEKDAKSLLLDIANKVITF